jgi:hypothetical protein
MMTDLRGVARVLLVACVSLLGPGTARVARADWVPEPRNTYSYEIASDPATGRVTVACKVKPPYTWGRDDYWFKLESCAHRGGVVRVNVQTGEVALLPCHLEQLKQGTTLTVDSCVPPGRYQYGLYKPVDCDAPYYGEVVVDAVPAGCTPAPGMPVAAVGEMDPPWKDEGNWNPCQSGGCSLGRHRASGVVFAAQGLALILGLALLLRRRRTRR